ncbi:MAG TPA: hypothetical protein VFP72_24470 [Kineosporiaceae bacterium]|nr:hypothetical protein [Kineosporiaceae bacterium]
MIESATTLLLHDRYRREVLRSPVWLVWGWLLGAGAVLVSLSGFAFGDLSSALFGGVLMGLPGAWVVARLPFVRVVLTTEGLVNHGVFRNRRMAWSEVDRVTVSVVSGGQLFTSYAPVLVLNGGREWALMQLAGYSTAKRVQASRVGRQAARIEAQVMGVHDTSPGDID